MKENINNQKSSFSFDDIIDNVIILDRQGRIEEINQSALNLLNYRREDLLGKPMRKVCKAFSLKKIMDEAPLENHETTYLTRAGKEIPVHVNITARRDPSADGQAVIKSIIFIARDMGKIKALITELTQSRKKLESSYAELRDSKDDLVRSEKLVFTGRIAASIAHEIRNPLTNVRMSIQELAKVIKSDAPQAKYTDIILRNTERINFLITELLNCARPPKLDMRAHDVHKLLKNVLESAKSKITSQKIKTVKKFTTESALINLDKEQMGRVFLNLVINAIDAMPKAGKLTVITDRKENFFEVKIQDTGKGIPEGDIIRIFDPFFSSKQGGVGLGLTICYGIIVSHRGTIEVESSLNAGSTFTIYLPI